MTTDSGRRIPVGKRHRTTRDVEMRVYDYERGVEVVRLPEGSIFQPWEPFPQLRGREVAITLGGDAVEFDWGVSSPDGHFLRWDDFFTHCEPEEGGAAPSCVMGDP